jgi:hypothetical protein
MASDSSAINKYYNTIFALLGYYTASSGNPLSTFRDNLSVPFSRVKKSKKKRTFWTS